MGGERPGNWLGHPLSAMQIAPDRVSAIDAEVYYPFDCECSFRAKDFPKGILLPGLPLHLEYRRRQLAFADRFFGETRAAVCARRPRQSWCSAKRGSCLARLRFLTSSE